MGDFFDLFEFLVGFVMFVFGYEWRKEFSIYMLDLYFVVGLIFGILDFCNGLINFFDGEYDVLEYFVEVIIFLLEGVDFVEWLELCIVYRSLDYDLYGMYDVWMIGIVWLFVDIFSIWMIFFEVVWVFNINEVFVFIFVVLFGVGDDFCN